MEVFDGLFAAKVRSGSISESKLQGYFKMRHMDIMVSKVFTFERVVFFK